MVVTDEITFKIARGIKTDDLGQTNKKLNNIFIIPTLEKNEKLNSSA